MPPRSDPGAAAFATVFLSCALSGAGSLFFGAAETALYAPEWWLPAVCAAGALLFGIVVTLLAFRVGGTDEQRRLIWIWIPTGGVIGAVLASSWIRLGAELAAGADLAIAAGAVIVPLLVIGPACVAAAVALGMLIAPFAGPREQLKVALRAQGHKAGGYLLCAGVVLGVHFFFPGSVERAFVESVPGAPRVSPFLARERENFAAILQKRRYEVLVVPFGARGPSVDRPARSLMTRYVARHLSRQSPASVADPTLVARALGAAEREIPMERAQQLARSIGAHTLITGVVTRPGGTFTLELEVHKAGADGMFRSAAKQALRELPFGDENPPEEAFRLRLADLGALGLPARAAALQDTMAGELAADLPPTPEDLIRGAQAPLERALRLQWLAATYTVPDVTPAEHLWERSLVALLDAEDDLTARLLRARANFWLGRRPYALKLLGKPATPEARAFRALLMGNLDESVRHAAAVRHASLAQIARLECEDLRAHYGRFEHSETRLDAEMKARPAYAAWQARAFSRDEWFQHPVRSLIGAALAERSVPGFDREIYWKDELITVLRIVWHAYAQVPGAVAERIEGARTPLWRARSNEWAQASAAAALAEWDLHEALFAANLESVVVDIESTHVHQGRPKLSVRLTGPFLSLFAGAPSFATMRARALAGAANQSLADGEIAYRLRAARIARDVIAWEGGESWLEARSRAALRDPFDAPAYQDEPPREFRHAPTINTGRFGATRIDVRDLEARLAHLRRALVYTHHEHAYVEQAYEILVTLGRAAEAQALVAENDARFGGSPGRDAFLAQAQQRTLAKGEALAAALERLVRTQPENWDNYFRLARERLIEGKAQEARDTLQRYPGFADPNAEPVALANSAFNGARLLYDAGELKLSEPLLEVAAKFDNGAASEMAAASYLARAKGGYTAASAHMERIFKQYGSGSAAADAATFAFMTGDSERGWKLIEAAAKHSSVSVELARAAVNGHRAAGSTFEQLQKWTASAGLSGHSDEARALMREAVLITGLFVDRVPTDESLRLAEPLLGRTGNRPIVLLANGLLALKKKEYAQAAPPLEELHQLMVNASLSSGESVAITWPYFALVSMKTGNAAKLRSQIEQFRARLGLEFYSLLADATLEGLEGRHDAAIGALKRALYSPANASMKPFQPEWQLLETCEQLYAETGREAYRALLVDMARRLTRGYPYAFGFSTLAKYSPDADERTAALGKAIFLDRRSARVQEAKPEEMRLARERFEREQPFGNSKQQR